MKRLPRADTVARIENRIKDRREAAGLTQTELARKVGLDKVDMHLIETGQKPASVAVLTSLARVLREPWERFYPMVQLSWADPPTQHAPSSQTAKILALLKERGERGLTPIDALDMVGSFRLGARIWDLKREGWPIDTVDYRTPSGAIVARYILRGERP